MGWPNSTEVASVQREDSRDVEPFGHRNDEGIDGAERKVRILLDKIGGAKVIGGEGVEDTDGTISNLSKKSCFALRRGSSTKEVANLSQGRRRQNQRLTIVVQERHYGFMSWIASDQDCHFRTGICKNHQSGSRLKLSR